MRVLVCRLPGSAAALCLAAGLLAAVVAVPAQAEVVLKGLSRTTEKVVRASIALDDEPCDAADARVRRLFRRADREIRLALEVYGYYAPTIEKALTRTSSCWQATFDIVRGPRVTLREVKVAVTGPGATDPGLAELVRDQPFEAGEGLNQRAYEEYKATIARRAEQRGYFEGRFAEKRIDVYPDEGVADLVIDYASGPRYRFGQVTFEQAVLDEGLARSYLEFSPGEPYDAERISELYTALLANGYFQGVEIRTTPRPAPDLDVAVTVVLSPSLPRIWTAGVGYSSDTGINFRLDFLHQRLSRRGHQFEFNSLWSKVLGEATLSYRMPFGNPRDEWLGLTGGYKYENPDQNRSDEYRVGVKQVVRRGQSWLETRFLDYIHERFLVGQERGTSNLVLPGLVWTSEPRLPQSRPRSAHKVALRLSGTDEVLGSDTAFIQANAAGKAIFPLWSTARLITRAEIGWTAEQDFDELPFSVRYFTGGDNTVRGYAYKSLGPTDEEGQVIGGSELLVWSVELDQKVYGNWSVAAFVDQGNAFNNFKDMGLKTSVGAGIRWFSPLGPIRLDVGVPLADDAPDNFRIHVTIGPDL